MPQVDLGLVVGPNLVNGNTASTLNGVLAANGTNVTIKPVDSAPDSANANNLVSSKGVADAIAAGLKDAYLVTLQNVSSSKLSFSVPGITASHVLPPGCATLSNPSAAGSNLTVVTSANNVTIQGTLIGTTNITMVLGILRTVTGS